MFSKGKVATATATATATKGVFRVGNKGVFLTYKTHLNEEQIKKALACCSPWIVDEWIACHEIGTDKGCDYAHTHIAVFCTKKIETRNSRTWDIDGIHPNAQGVRNKVMSINYIMKDGNYWGDMDFDDYKDKHIPNVVDKILDQPTVIEAFKLAGSIKDMVNIRTVYEAQDKIFVDGYDEELRNYKPIGWQIGLWEMLSLPADKRSVHWIWEEVGHMGKTMAGVMWLAHHQQETILINAINRVGDALNNVTNRLHSGHAIKYVFINLSRQAENRDQIYAIAECIKDGIITNNKYRCLTKIMRPPHVVIFANFAPSITGLSRDRWVITELAEKFDTRGCEGAPVTLIKGHMVADDIDEGYSN